MYFEMFPQIIYTQDDYATGQIVPDVLRRIRLSDELKSNNSFYDEYDVKDGETPEIVASYFYRNPQYHWIILVTNDIVYPRFDWPMTQPNLVEYCKSKYGTANIYSTHHFTNASGYEVNSTAVGAVPVSNFTFEDEQNEGKRRIKVLKPELISEIVSNFDSLIKE